MEGQEYSISLFRFRVVENLVEGGAYDGLEFLFRKVVLGDLGVSFQERAASSSIEMG
tara:strand:+ start:490 stop:660 length:171 start_codon:yes stop_codon:yes gene_type:complete